MNISQVKTATKIARAYLKKHNSGEWKLEYCAEKSLLKDSRGRVYFLVVDGVICKMGGSQSKMGIKSTMYNYQTAMGGSPSLRSVGIHKHIEAVLSEGKTVEIYCIWGPQSTMEVPGLFESTSMPVAPFKEMETNCLKDYKDVEGCYPIWNYQENGIKWPAWIRDEYDYVKNGN